MTTPRASRRPLTTLAVVGGLLLGATVVPAPSTASTASPTVSGLPCALGAGVSVVVDTRGAGGTDIRLGCAPGTATSGLDALSRSGFTAALVTAGPAAGAVCQLDGLPGPETPCFEQTAYWAYWTSTGTAPWSYAQTGATVARTVARDAIEGWAFGDGPEPGITVDEVDARRPVTLRVTATPTPVLAGRGLTVAASGLRPWERYRLTYSTMAVTGSASSTGTVRRTLSVPSTWSMAERRARVNGAHPGRTGARTVWTVRPATLPVSVSRTSLGRGGTQWVTVSRLAPGERVRVRYLGRTVSPSTLRANRYGRATASFRVGTSTGSRTVYVNGAYDVRRGSATFTVR